MDQELIAQIERIVDSRVAALLGPTPYDLRLKKGIQKIATLSRLAGVHAQTLRKYERGEIHQLHESSYVNFGLIACVLGCSRDDYAAAVQRQVQRQRAYSR